MLRTASMAVVSAFEGERWAQRVRLDIDAVMPLRPSLPIALCRSERGTLRRMEVRLC